jgi:hypothetical protein
MHTPPATHAPRAYARVQVTAPGDAVKDRTSAAATARLLTQVINTVRADCGEIV